MMMASTIGKTKGFSSLSLSSSSLVSFGTRHLSVGYLQVGIAEHCSSRTTSQPCRLSSLQLVSAGDLAIEDTSSLKHQWKYPFTYPPSIFPAHFKAKWLSGEIHTRRIWGAIPPRRKGNKVHQPITTQN